MPIQYTNVAWAVSYTRTDDEPIQLMGTATPLAGPYLLTAKHVTDAVAEKAKGDSRACLICEMTPNNFGSFQYEVTASWADIDISLIEIDPAEASFPRHPARVLRGTDPEQMVGTEVSATGFPHIDANHYFYRYFRGYITSARRAGETTARLADETNVYELSFSCPKGLSGAGLVVTKHPVMINGDPAPVLHGIVVGDHQSQLEEHYEESETVEGKTATYTFSHYTSFGIAVEIGQIMERIVDGRTLEEILIGDHEMFAVGYPPLNEKGGLRKS